MLQHPAPARALQLPLAPSLPPWLVPPNPACLQPYTILELPRSGVKVGVVGLTTVDTPETSSPGPNVRFLPYNETLPGCVADAKADGAQIIVALTHIGFPDDQLLAADPSAADLDLIVGEAARRRIGWPVRAGRCCVHAWAGGADRQAQAGRQAAIEVFLPCPMLACRRAQPHAAVRHAAACGRAAGGQHGAAHPHLAAHQREL